MKISPVALALASALVGAVAWGSCQSGRASDAERRVAALLAQDSLDDAGHQHFKDSTGRVLDSLTHAATVLTARNTALARAVPAARDSIRQLLTRLPESTAGPLEAAVRTLTLSADACAASLENAEARATVCQTRATADSVRIEGLEALSRHLEGEWKSAEQRARPSFLRDIWRSRRVTLPLLALTTFLILDRR